MPISAKVGTISVKAYLDINSSILFRHLDLTDSTTCVDEFQTSIGRALALDDTVTPADVLTTLLGADLQQALNDTIAMAETEIFDMGLQLSDASAISEALANDIGAVQSDNLTTSDSLGAVLTPTATTTFSTTAKSVDVILSNGNLTAARPSKTTGFVSAGVRSTTSHNTGKYYFEASPTKSNDNIGLAPASAALDNSSADVILPAVRYTCNGFVNVNGGATTVIMPTAVTGDVVCFAVDFSTGKVWVRKNTDNWNADASANPATGVGGLSFTVSGPMFIGCAFNNTDAVGVTINVGNTAFAVGPPSGFSIWG